MKILVISIAILFIICNHALALNDTLVIKLKNNQIEKIAVSQIEKINLPDNL